MKRLKSNKADAEGREFKSILESIEEISRMCDKAKLGEQKIVYES